MAGTQPTGLVVLQVALPPRPLTESVKRFTVGVSWEMAAILADTMLCSNSTQRVGNKWCAYHQSSGSGGGGVGTNGETEPPGSHLILIVNCMCSCFIWSHGLPALETRGSKLHKSPDAPALLRGARGLANTDSNLSIADRMPTARLVLPKAQDSQPGIGHGAQRCPVSVREKASAACFGLVPNCWCNRLLPEGQSRTPTSRSLATGGGPPSFGQRDQQFRQVDAVIQKQAGGLQRAPGPLLKAPCLVKGPSCCYCSSELRSRTYTLVQR